MGAAMDYANSFHLILFNLKRYDAHNVHVRKNRYKTLSSRDYNQFRKRVLFCFSIFIFHFYRCTLISLDIFATKRTWFAFQMPHQIHIFIASDSDKHNWTKYSIFASVIPWRCQIAMLVRVNLLMYSNSIESNVDWSYFIHAT